MTNWRSAMHPIPSYFMHLGTVRHVQPDVLPSGLRSHRMGSHGTGDFGLTPRPVRHGQARRGTALLSPPNSSSWASTCSRATCVTIHALITSPSPPPPLDDLVVLTHTCIHLYTRPVVGCHVRSI